MAPLHPRKIPWPLILAYALDWIIIIIIAAIGGGLSYKTPANRLFSPLNPAISYPYSNYGISASAMFVVSIVMPGLVIAVVVVLLLPSSPPAGAGAGAAAPSYSPAAFLKRAASRWRQKVWEINAGWLGLALASALALLITQAVKASFGKPRPDLLDRCQPDLSGLDLSGTTLPSQLLLDRSACTQRNKAVVDDGFRSFFSGHSSSSFAGLLYLSLWLALKFNMVLPRPSGSGNSNIDKRLHNRKRATPVTHSSDLEAADAARETNHKHSAEDEAVSYSSSSSSSIRFRASAPPTWTALLFFAPILLATWIASTRWIEYKHDGWDVGLGILFGTLCAIFGFRWYHSDPILAGESWTWGPRSRREAFLLRPSILTDGEGEGSGTVNDSIGSRSNFGASAIRRKQIGAGDSVQSGRSGSFNETRHGVSNGAGVEHDSTTTALPAAAYTHAPSEVHTHQQA